jgi:hypothetical protein
MGPDRSSDQWAGHNQGVDLSAAARLQVTPGVMWAQRILFITGGQPCRVHS